MATKTATKNVDGFLTKCYTAIVEPFVKAALDATPEYRGTVRAGAHSLFDSVELLGRKANLTEHLWGAATAAGLADTFQAKAGKGGYDATKAAGWVVLNAIGEKQDALTLIKAPPGSLVVVNGIGPGLRPMRRGTKPEASGPSPYASFS